MRKFFVTLIVLLMFVARADAAEISCADSTFAFETINQKLREWNCTPLKIWYSDVALDDAANVAYMNTLAKDGNKFTACMLFYSDFRSPPDNGTLTAWEYDSVYKDYSWYFGRREDGTWQLVTWGY